MTKNDDKIEQPANMNTAPKNTDYNNLSDEDKIKFRAEAAQSTLATHGQAEVDDEVIEYLGLMPDDAYHPDDDEVFFDNSNDQYDFEEFVKQKKREASAANNNESKAGDNE